MDNRIPIEGDIMVPLEWIGLLLGLGLSLDMVCAQSRGWRAGRVALKRGRTAPAKHRLRAVQRHDWP